MACCSASTWASQQALLAMPLARQVVTAAAHSGVNVDGTGAAGVCSASKAARQWPQIQAFVERNQDAFALHSARETEVAVAETQAFKAAPSVPLKLKAFTARQTSPEALQAQLNHGFVGMQAAATQ
jgi:hypothetical protein